MLSKAKHLCSAQLWDPLTLAPTGVDLRFTSSYSLRSSKISLIFTLRNGQDDKFTNNFSVGSTSILLPKLNITCSDKTSWLLLTVLNVGSAHCKIITNKLYYFICLHYICMPQPTNGCGDILVKERFAFIHRRNLDNFSLSWIMSKALTLVLYMHPINGVCYIPFGVGYCLLQIGRQSRASAW